MTTSPYDKAVETFEAIVTAPRRSACHKPAQIIAETGQSSSSGYRRTAALEAEAFLRRDSNGAYLLGTAGVRTACSACGLGRLAPVLPAILQRLRADTQHTSFCAFLSGTDVQIGPFLKGRMSRSAKLAAAYRLEQPLQLSPDQPTTTTLISNGVDIVHRSQVVLAMAASSQTHVAAIGLLLRPGQATAAYVSDALTTAAGKVAQ